MCLLTRMMSTALITERIDARILLSVKLVPKESIAKYQLAEYPISDSKHSKY